MFKSIYLAANGRGCGKRNIALGLMKLLREKQSEMAVFRPIIADPKEDGRDSVFELLDGVFNLGQDYEQSYGCTASQAAEIMGKDSRQALIELVIEKYRRLEEKRGFVLCIGSDFRFSDPVFEFGLNAEIADTIGAPVILVVDAKQKALAEIRQSLHSCRLALGRCELIATLINKADLSVSEVGALAKSFGDGGRNQIYALPDAPALSTPTLGDVARALGAEFITGSESYETPVRETVVAAMHVENFLRYLKEGALVITPGDRPDILFATLSAKLSSRMPSASGILLTGGIHPTPAVMDTIGSVAGGGIPMLITKEQTISATNALYDARAGITAKDSRKVDASFRLFEHCVDGMSLLDRVSKGVSDKISSLMFEQILVDLARKNKQRIVLCEGEEPRILLAAAALLRKDAADLIILGDETAIRQKAEQLQADISKATLINPATSPKYQEYAEAYCEYRKAKGMTMEKALKTMLDATYFGTMMVKQGDADGMVSGAVNTTAHTIRPAFEFIKTRPGSSVVSSVFLMCLQNRVLVFGDCAVNPNPTAPQLAEIAMASARTAQIFGIEPRVAMLSYSTGTSGKGPDVDVVTEATKIVKEQAPDLLVEGPIQYDAAMSPDVAKTKLPGSKVAGRATVFIFPDLNTGNNTYKAVQRAANAVAIGPVLQGLKKPVNDLSRGCLVPDIVNTVVITALQAAAGKQA